MYEFMDASPGLSGFKLSSGLPTLGKQRNLEASCSPPTAKSSGNLRSWREDFQGYSPHYSPLSKV